jgi:2,3-diketo-5-methylthio-1-phosphopentane phosphatase/HAD superfamily hydrolase (TIGR01509 family)
MKHLILCDFDGTISVRDTGYLLLQRFSSGDWETLDQEFREGKIGSKEAYVRIGPFLKGSREEFLAFVREHLEIDPSFIPFYRFCRDAGMDVRIVSDGFDFYIDAILEQHGLREIPFDANTCRFLPGDQKEVSFPHWNEDCGLCGTCKRKLVQRYRRHYDSIFYAGDGLSDRCATQEADFTFAKGTLYDFCINADIPCHFYQDFHDILNDLRKRIRGVIFDLDGTLIDGYRGIYLGLEAAWQALGHTIFPFRDLRKYLKADLESTLRDFFPAADVQKVLPIMRERYEEVYLDHTHLLDGSREVLEAFHRRGILMGVASNKLGRFSREALAHLGIARYFKSVIGAGDVPRNKPFPDMIHAVLKCMDLLPEDIIYVGDTPSDIEAGKLAGVDVYALSTGYHSNKELARGRPKRLLNDLLDLVAAVNPIAP